MTDANKFEAERQKRLRQRNWALAGALVLFVVLVFIVSIVKMGGA
jgi:type IV secretory pathway component VirB8